MQRAINSSLSQRSLNPGMMSLVRPRLTLMMRWTLGLQLIVHGLMIIIGPLAWNLNRLGTLGDVLYFYGEAAGTNSQYAFFSPGISIQIRVLFLVKKDQGSPELIEFLSGRSREVDLRLGDISDQFLTIAMIQDPIGRKLQRSLAASLTASIFSRYPEARSVVLIIEEFLPKPLRTQEPYPAPRWRQVYRIEFSRHTKGAAP